MCTFTLTQVGSLILKQRTNTRSTQEGEEKNGHLTTYNKESLRTM